MSARDRVAEVRAAFERLRPQGVVAAYVYGSHAEGRSHAESDVDVAVLLDRGSFSDAQRFEERLRLTGALAGEIGTDAVDVVVLNDVPPLLGRRIVTTGIRVHCEDAEATHAFVRNVQLRAADVEPFLRRTRRVKLASLAR
jgi:predicted nucleotidyltransferase